MIEIHKLVRSKRKTLALIVEPDGTLTVRAPLRMKEADIRSFIEGKKGLDQTEAGQAYRKMRWLLVSMWMERSFCIWGIKSLAHRSGRKACHRYGQSLQADEICAAASRVRIRSLVQKTGAGSTYRTSLILCA